MGKGKESTEEGVFTHLNVVGKEYSGGPWKGSSWTTNGGKLALTVGGGERGRTCAVERRGRVFIVRNADRGSTLEVSKTKLGKHSKRTIPYSGALKESNYFVYLAFHNHRGRNWSVKLLFVKVVLTLTLWGRGKKAKLALFTPEATVTDPYW